jgi:prepilin-type N-terminal cleavage/methylation domain-containing protein
MIGEETQTMTDAQNDFDLRKGGEHGFSLIEVIIAIVVITFGLVSVVGISAYVSRTNSISGTLSVLATAAQDQVDRLRTVKWSKSFTDPALAVSTATGIGGSLTSDVTNYFATRTGTPAGVLKVRWQVRQGATADLRWVTINVVQINAPPQLRDGFTVTTAITRR